MDHFFDPDGYSEADFDAILGDFEPKKRGDKRNLNANKGNDSMGRTRKSDEEVDDIITKNYNGNLKRVSKYWGRFSPLRCVCTLCGGDSYKSRAEGFFRGYAAKCGCEAGMEKRLRNP